MIVIAAGDPGDMRIDRESVPLDEPVLPASIAPTILGLGNILLGDEGVGVHAMRALEQDGRCPAGAIFVDGGTLSFTLAAYIQNSDALIVFDAVAFGSPAGTVRVFEGAAMDDFLGGNRKHSVHEVSLLDLMAVAALSEHLPRRRALIGIQPQSFAWRDTPTPEVVHAIPEACAATLRLLERWQIS